MWLHFSVAMQIKRNALIIKLQTEREPGFENRQILEEKNESFRKSYTTGIQL